MTPDRTDANPDENAEHGVLDESGNLDTASITILGSHIAQVNVDLPVASHDDDVDDDVVEDEVPVDEAEIRPFETIGLPFPLEGGAAVTYVPEPQVEQPSTEHDEVHDEVHVEHLPTGDIVLEPHDGEGSDEIDAHDDVHDAEIVDETADHGGEVVVPAFDDRTETAVILSTDEFDPGPHEQDAEVGNESPDDVAPAGGEHDDVGVEDAEVRDVDIEDVEVEDVHVEDADIEDVGVEDVHVEASDVEDAHVENAETGTERDHSLADADLDGADVADHDSTDGQPGGGQATVVDVLNDDAVSGAGAVETGPVDTGHETDAEPAEPLTREPWPGQVDDEAASAGDSPTQDEFATTDEPVVDEPRAEEPAAENRAAGEPAAEEPVAEEPAVAEPVADELTADEPVAAEPVADEPAAAASDTGAVSTPTDAVPTTTGAIPRTRAERAATGAIGTVPLTRRQQHQAEEAARSGRTHALERVRTPAPDLTLTSKRLGEIDATRESSDLLTADRLLDPRQVSRPEPEGLWQQLVYSISGHRINLGDGRRARQRKELDRRIAAPLAGGARFVPVLSRKGGVGKTTVTSLLGMALADARDDRVIAVDANPDRGTLADRVGRPNGRTVRDLVRAHDEVEGYHDVSSIVARDATRLDVLASDSDPRVSEAFSDDDYRQVADVAAHYYSIVLTDTGTGIVHSVMEATLERADSLIVVAGLSVDEARLASETLTWLETNGYADRVRSAIVVLNSARPGTPLVRESELEAHFRSRVQTVIRMPYDPRIAAGSAIAFRELQPETRQAARELAAAVVEGLRTPVAAA